MAQVFTRVLLSGATNGAGVPLTTSPPGDTVIHASLSGTTKDEIWLYASNQSASATTCTLFWGQTQTGGSQSIITSISPNSGLVLIVPGLILSNGLYVSGRAGANSAIVVYGFVNRITET